MSTSDWIHCNSCIAQPSASVQYFFSSCGHILCKKCLSKVTEQPPVCSYCKKQAQFVPINRSLKAEIQMLFRNPRDLASEYMKNLSTVLDFQNSHRSRLSRAHMEQQKKAVKFVQAAQGEMKKRIDNEKKVIAENTEIKCELDKTRTHVQKLEALLASRELELEHFRRNAFQSPHKPAAQYQRSDSGLGDTPMSSLSFIDAITSTPINQSPSRSGSGGRRRSSKDRLKEMFTSTNGSVPSPIVQSTTTTPGLLGMNKQHKRSSSEHSRRTQGMFFDNDELMDVVGGGF